MWLGGTEQWWVGQILISASIVRRGRGIIGKLCGEKLVVSHSSTIKLWMNGAQRTEVHGYFMTGPPAKGFDVFFLTISITRV